MFIIFDFDGVLVDSESIAIEEEFKFLNDLLGITFNEYLEFFAFLDSQSWKNEYRCLIKGGLISERRFLEFEKDLSNKILKSSKPFPYLDNFIKKLIMLGYDFCIVSNNTKKNIKEILMRHDTLNRQFANKKIFTPECVGYKKPDRRIYLETLKQLRLENRNNVIVIEDTENGIIAAKKAGIKTIFFEGNKYARLIKNKKCIELSNLHVKNYKELIISNFWDERQA